jgi:hypothetical protein
MSLERFTLARIGGTKTIVLSLEGVSGTLRVPAEVLTPSEDYLWSASSQGAVVQGRFSVISRAEAAALAAAEPSLGDSTLERALFLQQQGFEFDGMRIIRELNSQNKR